MNEHIKKAYEWLSRLVVAGDNVDILAMARQELRMAQQETRMAQKTAGQESGDADG